MSPSPPVCEPLQVTLDEVLEDATNEMNGLARITLRRAQAQWRELDEHLVWCDERITRPRQGQRGRQTRRPP